MKKLLFVLIIISFCSCEQLRHGNSSPFMSGYGGHNCQCRLVDDGKFVKPTKNKN